MSDIFEPEFDFNVPPPRRPPEPIARFNGPTYDPEFDYERLARQTRLVFDGMRDGHWRTLSEIAAITYQPHASVSAQLRHLRKKRFGGFVVEKRPRGDRSDGLYEYQLLVPPEPV